MKFREQNIYSFIYYRISLWTLATTILYIGSLQ